MVLTSKFKDYYDGAVSYGFNPDIHFIRETVNLPPQTPHKEISRIVNQISSSWFLKNEVDFLFFCGKIYPIFNLRPVNFKDPCFGTKEDYVKNMETRDLHIRNEFYKDREKSYNGRICVSEKGVKLIEQMAGQKVDDELFRELGVPYFLVKHNRENNQVVIKKLPQLSKYSFFKYMDSFTCFQEIMMYIGNILTVQDKMPLSTGGDKVLAQAKGFDEMSFRTMAPGKKKENRRNNKEKKKLDKK